jgi:hypothetical protein
MVVHGSRTIGLSLATCGESGPEEIKKRRRRKKEKDVNFSSSSFSNAYTGMSRRCMFRSQKQLNSQPKLARTAFYVALCTFIYIFPE